MQRLALRVQRLALAAFAVSEVDCAIWGDSTTVWILLSRGRIYCVHVVTDHSWGGNDDCGSVLLLDRRDGRKALGRDGLDYHV